MECSGVQEAGYKDGGARVYDVQGPAEIVFTQVAMWAFHSPQMLAQTYIERQALLQALGPEVPRGL